jgi:hypothetical protein
MVAPIINTTFLNQIGLLQRLPIWRAAFANRRAPELEPQADSGETEQPASILVACAPGSRTANQLQEPPPATQTTDSGRPQSAEQATAADPARRRSTWLYAGAVAVLIMAGLWFKTQVDLNQVEPAFAKTPPSDKVQAVVPSMLPTTEASPTPTTPAAPQATAPAPSVVVSEEPIARETPSETTSKLAPSLPATEPKAAAVAASPAVTNAPPSVRARVENTVPDFRLTGIFYSAHPSAIVNGQTVSVGDRVSGATVVAIGRSAVTLQFNRERRTYELQ